MNDDRRNTGAGAGSPEESLSLDAATRLVRDRLWRDREQLRLGESRRSRLARSIRARLLMGRTDAGVPMPPVQPVMIGGRLAYVTVQDFSGTADDWTL